MIRPSSKIRQSSSRTALLLAAAILVAPVVAAARAEAQAAESRNEQIVRQAFDRWAAGRRLDDQGLRSVGRRVPRPAGVSRPRRPTVRGAFVPAGAPDRPRHLERRRPGRRALGRRRHGAGRALVSQQLRLDLPHARWASRRGGRVPRPRSLRRRASAYSCWMSGPPGRGDLAQPPEPLRARPRTTAARPTGLPSRAGYRLPHRHRRHRLAIPGAGHGAILDTDGVAPALTAASERSP